MNPVYEVHLTGEKAGKISQGWGDNHVVPAFSVNLEAVLSIPGWKHRIVEGLIQIQNDQVIEGKLLVELFPDDEPTKGKHSSSTHGT